jgi:glycosyltransferase involved in cell wall biosynthesis
MSKKIIHLVYPHKPRISAPDAIGRHLGQRLEQAYRVIYHDLESLQAIHPSSDDVLLGHAMPSPFTCFRQSLKQPGWQRVLLITPYSHGDPQYNAYIDRFIGQCDMYMAITGNFWFRTIQDSIFSHWLPKMVHLDMAVDRNDFPVLKNGFNPPGQRKFVYIGVYKACKNLSYLNQIAARFPAAKIDWIGTGRSFSHLKPRGAYDFSTPEAKKLIQSYDFLITVGSSDANPTTILEAMSWGLVPVCTQQSGYADYDGIVNLPLDDLESAVKILNNLQALPEDRLRAMQQDNWRALDNHFNWERFSNQVIEAVESEASPAVMPISTHRRWLIRWAELKSVYAIWRRPRHLSRVLAFFISQMMAPSKTRTQ